MHKCHLELNREITFCAFTIKKLPPLLRFTPLAHSHSTPMDSILEVTVHKIEITSSEWGYKCELCHQELKLQSQQKRNCKSPRTTYIIVLYIYKISPYKDLKNWAHKGIIEHWNFFTSRVHGNSNVIITKQ